MLKKWSILLSLLLTVVLLTGEYHRIDTYIQIAAKSEEADKQEVEEGNGLEGEKKTAYLTFDDGPSELTVKYLEILEKYQIKATFFIIGQQVEGDMKNVIQREIEEGHEIGIHTYTHVSEEIYQSADSYYQDVCRVRNLLKEEFNYKPLVWRFPWGSANCSISSYKKDIIDRLQGEKLDYVDWNVTAEDSVGYPTSYSILTNIKKTCFKVDSPIILMHDSNCNQATLDTLESVILMLKEQGYGFATISERKEVCHFGEY